MNRTRIFAFLFACLLLVSSLASAGPLMSVNAPDIDDLTEALTVKAGQSYIVGDADLSTFQTGEPADSCHSGTRPSVWFKYKADRDITVTFDTIGSYFPYGAPNQLSEYDTTMSLYALASGTPSTATFENLWYTVCNDDIALGNRFSRLTVEVDAGLWYYIRLTPYQGFVLPVDSYYVLNVTAQNLINNSGFETHAGADEWTLSGKGIADDKIDISNPNDYDMEFTHSDLGASKLTQVIDTFKGVKLTKSNIAVTSNIEFGGAGVDMKLTLKITYTDGTSEKATATTDTGLKLIGVTSLNAELSVDKPVAKITVQFKDKTTTGAWASVDDVVLSVLPGQGQAYSAALPAPSPAAK